MSLLIIGFVAGLVAGISPCILPVLPVILVTGATGATEAAGATSEADGTPRSRTFRSLAVVAGVIVSFSVVILAGSELLSALGLPQDSLRDAGIALLVLIGLSFLIPPLAELIERPFSRVSVRQPSGSAGGFVIGLGLGVLFVPCAGPVLAAITVVGATHRVGFRSVLLTAAFALGAGVPLLIVALGGSELTRRVHRLRQQAPRIRQVGGIILIAMALAIGFNTFASLQRDVPGYTSALQDHVEGSTHVRKELSQLTGNGHASLASCNSNATTLINCGRAPNFTGVTAWLNTPGDRPLSLSQLRGKVVLVDFWTYSCINCQRTLPHVEAWYKRYEPDGLVVVGVSTPEFAFEHVVSNVRSQSAALGVRYPVAVDDDYKTWDAYDNEYWPADYLVDASGNVRHVHFGEGDYSDTESLIRQLLTAAHPGLTLPKATDVPDLTPTEETNPETYVGYDRLQYILNTQVAKDAAARYSFPSSLVPGGFALAGTWTVHAQEATAGAGAELELGFQAEDVYLVMGGSGTVTETLDGQRYQTITVDGVPRLYTLFHSPGALASGTMVLKLTPGVQAYDFTFG